MIRKKLKESDILELTQADAKGKWHCRDYFSGVLKKEAFYRTMRDFAYTDSDLEEDYAPTPLYPTLPGTRKEILGWAVGCGYIAQEDYDAIEEAIRVGI